MISDSPRRRGATGESRSGHADSVGLPLILPGSSGTRAVMLPLEVPHARPHPHVPPLHGRYRPPTIDGWPRGPPDARPPRLRPLPIHLSPRNPGLALVPLPLVASMPPWVTRLWI